MNNNDENKKMKINLQGFPNEDDSIEIPEPPKVKTTRQRMEDEVRKFVNGFLGFHDINEDDEEDDEEAIRKNQLIELINEVESEMDFDSLEDDIKAVFSEEAKNMSMDPEDLFEDIKSSAASYLKKSSILDELNNALIDDDDDDDDDSDLSFYSISLSDLQKMASNGGMNGLTSGIAKFLESILGDDDSENDEDKDEANFQKSFSNDANELYDLYRLRYLAMSSFGNIEAVEDEEIYKHFQEKFGTDSTKYFDDAYGLQQMYVTSGVQNLPLSEIKDSKYILFTPKYILFYAEPKDPDYFGFYYAVVEDRDGGFSILIPEYGNTFILDKSGKARLFNFQNKEEAEYFVPIEKASKNLVSQNVCKNDKYIFLSSNLGRIDIGIQFTLFTPKRVLCSPSMFGKIKLSRVSPKKSSQFLQIGTIVSNESSEAILMKRDADLDLDKTEFPIYIKFNDLLSATTLDSLSQVFFALKSNDEDDDINESELLKNVELMYTSDGRLYFEHPLFRSVSE